MRILVSDRQPVSRVGLKSALMEQIPAVELIDAEHPQIVSDVLTPWAETYGHLDFVVCDPAPTMPRLLSPMDLDPFLALAGQTPMIVFSGSEHPADISLALSYKVAAYIPKTVDISLIGSILQLVRAGGVYVPPCLAHPYKGNGQNPTYSIEIQGQGPLGLAEEPPYPYLGPHSNADFTPIPSAIASLTKRQRQVLELLSQGLSNADIGKHLDLNLSTVKSHVTGVLKVLGVSSRTQAVLLFKQQWPQPPSAKPGNGRLLDSD